MKKEYVDKLKKNKIAIFQPSNNVPSISLRKTGVARLKSVPVWPILLVVLLTVLTACGGGSNEAVEDTSHTDTGAVDDTTESEAIDDDNVGATGSEEDSGELPPAPDTGSKVVASRATPNIIASSDSTATTSAPPANRSDSIQNTAVRQLDLVLLLDATGSMADELDFLKAGLNEIAAQFNSQPDSTILRYGFVVYRDQEKSDSIQLFSLTNDWELFAETLMTVTAVGGGDYPENLNGGLYQAVTGMNWNPAAEHLLILLGDAPPHPDTGETVPFEEILLGSVAQNITIFTVGSDGLNETGAAIYQQIADVGNGRFIFVSHNPENNRLNAPVVQPITNLSDVFVEIVLEVLNDEEAP